MGSVRCLYETGRSRGVELGERRLQPPELLLVRREGRLEGGRTGHSGVSVVENLVEGDELRTDVDGVRRRIEEVGAANVLCVLSTTSCFAPRGVDKLLELGRLCEAAGVRGDTFYSVIDQGRRVRPEDARVWGAAAAAAPGDA